MNEFGHASSRLHCRWLLTAPAATLVVSVGLMGTVRTDASATTPKLPALLLSARRCRLVGKSAQRETARSVASGTRWR